MEINKIVEINELLDIYADLLTKKQKQVMLMYYEENLSLGEISEELGVSRQAVYDTIKKSEQLLYNYESLLKIKNTNSCNETFKKNIIEKLTLYESKYKNELTIQQLIDIKQISKFCKESLT